MTRFLLVDAFSDRPFGGNPAVIVPDARGLSDRAMQSLAAELRMEAGFLLPPTQPGADLRIRFFTPDREVDVSGHVTVAAYAALAAEGALPAGPRVKQETRAGVLTVELSGDAPWVTLGFGWPAFGAALDRAEVAAAMGARIAEGAAPRTITCGVSLGVVAMPNPTALLEARPDMAKVVALSRRRGVLGLCAYALPGLHPASALTARFFFPAVGPDEDAVSGAALAAICAYAVRERQLTCVGEATFQTDQGHSLSRPNRAEVTVRTEGGQIVELRVKGRGVVVARGEILPIE